MCQACWMAARRNVQQHLQQDANRDTSGAEIENVQAPELPPLPQESLFQPQRRQQEPTITYT